MTISRVKNVILIIIGIISLSIFLIDHFSAKVVTINPAEIPNLDNADGSRNHAPFVEAILSSGESITIDGGANARFSLDATGLRKHEKWDIVNNEPEYVIYPRIFKEVNEVAKLCYASDIKLKVTSGELRVFVSRLSKSDYYDDNFVLFIELADGHDNANLEVSFADGNSVIFESDNNKAFKRNMTINRFHNNGFQFRYSIGTRVEADCSRL